MAENYDKPVNEYYPTPKWCIKGLLDVINISDLETRGWLFAEPCRGEAKALYNLLPNSPLWMELEEGRNYLESAWSDYYPELTKNIDCIITNPPFSLGLDFIKKSLEESEVCIYLLRLGFLGSKKRHDFHSEIQPDHLVVCSSRPKFKNNTTENSEYAWFIYDKNNKLGLTKPFYFIKENK